MVLTKATKRRIKATARAYNMTVDMGRILKYARRASGFSQLEIARCMETTEQEWQYYERNRRQIPTHIMLKLVMFGMDFWCRNKQCFEFAYADTEMTELNQKSDIINQK